MVKFNSNGVRQWATYFGGNGDEIGCDIKVDTSDKIVIVGFTDSDIGISTAGSHQPNLSNNSNTDGFISLFNTDGIQQWGTYYGGSSSFSNFVGVTFDKSANIIAIGITASTNGISTAGAHQTAFGGGNSDFFIVKLNNNGSRLWGTYYGGSLSDEGIAITTDSLENIYFTGYTRSTNGIATSNAYQPIIGISTDAVIAKFNSFGIRQWATYFGGNHSDTGQDLVCNSTGNVFAVGNTTSTDLSTSIGAHQINYGGGTDDAFITMFSPCDLTVATAGSISGLTTVCNGQTSVSYTVPLISGATSYQWTLPSGVAGSSSTNSINLSFNSTAANVTISVRGLNACGYGPSSYRVIFIQQIPINAGLIIGESNNCQGATTNYSVPQITNANSYVWSLPVGATGSSTSNSITVDFGLNSTSGNVSVAGSNFCGLGGSSSKYVNIYATPATPVISVVGNFLQSSATSGNQWYNQNGIILSGTGQNYTPTANGSYYVLVTKNGCRSDTSNIITIANVGISETYERNYILCPNPAHSELTIEIPSNIENSSYEIYNVYGQLLCRGMLQNKTKISIANLPKGIYLLKFEDGGMLRFVKE